MIRSIPTGEYIRTSQACSNNLSFKSKIGDLNIRLHQGGYTNIHLEAAASKVQMRSRDSLLSQNVNHHAKECKSLNNNTLVFSTPYSSDFSLVKFFFYKYLPVLNKDPKLCTILEAGCKVVSRKGKT